MAGRGFYRMARGWQEGALFGADAFSKRDAWVWMIEEAAYVPRDLVVGGKVVKLTRGQFCHSLRFMAKAWKWDEAKVRRFIARAKTLSQIDASSDAGQTVITICNYDKYQSPSQANDAACDAQTTQQRRSNDANNNEGKESKELTKETDTADAAADYAFSGKVIRLRHGDLQKWKQSFSAVDVEARLQSRDDWLASDADEATKRRWFLSTSNWLATINEKAAITDRQRPKVPL